MNTFAPHLPLDENQKYDLNGILPPFEIEGRDGVNRTRLSKY
jgi:hypothetical protein